ncbi:MAG: HPF/RaiA family ribosome-associated protein [Gemmatimonadota bacterium]|nr:HPF/RaiA family ribosome-associated protein [Gemmatimonadota bacterium]
MQIQVNTDNNVSGREQFADYVRDEVESAMSRYTDRITRVEVHVSDENGDKGGGDDKRCVMEARLEGRQPTAVTHEADTVKGAVRGAADKLARSVAHALDRQHDLHPHAGS